MRLRFPHQHINEQRDHHTSCNIPVKPGFMSDIFEPKRNIFGTSAKNSNSARESAEYISLWLKDIGHEAWFYWYITGCVVISLLVYVLMRETKSHSEMDE